MEDVLIVVPHQLQEDEIEEYREHNKAIVNQAKKSGSYVVVDANDRCWWLC